MLFPIKSFHSCITLSVVSYWRHRKSVPRSASQPHLSSKPLFSHPLCGIRSRSISLPKGSGCFAASHSSQGCKWFGSVCVYGDALSSSETTGMHWERCRVCSDLLRRWKDWGKREEKRPEKVMKRQEGLYGRSFQKSRASSDQLWTESRTWKRNFMDWKMKSRFRILAHWMVRACRAF